MLLLAPNSEKYDELNNYSIVTRITYKSNSFIFTGDAEQISESEMLKKGYILKSDVLKVGHHGVSTSTTTPFLTAVSPEYAIISVGKDNTYGFPSTDTLKRISDAKAQILRTDESGTIIVISDGQNITIDKKAIIAPATTPTVTTYNYIGNKNSKIFHLPTCSTLPQPKNQIKFSNREEAVKAGYRPCLRCKP